MVETAIELKLNVPAQRSRRIALIDAARKTVSDANILPPVSLQTLEELATNVLEATNGNDDELAFILLMCSNELWRPYFEATPYNRRLLLLPQCLKNSNSCAAMVDDLGLICAGCNQCPIHSSLEVAEILGYSTLVAEGSSTAIALVEEGSVDAFLGVSCLEVLQKSFKQVVSSAIPSLAIPLLYDGCKDTEVDQQWLLDEIRAITIDPDRKTLSVSVMKNRVETLFSEEFLSTQFDIAANQSITGKLAIETMLQGGKRMRPLLTLMAYTAYSNDFNQPIAERLMLAVECFHKASLIHDDIEDGDDYRYNQKTAHHKYGIPLAINLGDYLIGRGYRKLSQLHLPSEIKLQLLDLFSSMHIESTIGQGEELAEAEIESVHDLTKTMTIFRQKTGSAIRVSLLAGAMAAKAPTSDCDILSEFSDLFGIAYQIRDDLTEFRGEATDQQCASFPFLKSMLVEKHKLIAANQQEWEKLIEKHQIDKIADEKLDEIRDRMTAVLKLISSQKLRFALLNVVNRFFEKR